MLKKQTAPNAQRRLKMSLPDNCKVIEAGNSSRFQDMVNYEVAEGYDISSSFISADQFKAIMFKKITPVVLVEDQFKNTVFVDYKTQSEIYENKKFFEKDAKIGEFDNNFRPVLSMSEAKWMRQNDPTLNDNLPIWKNQHFKMAVFLIFIWICALIYLYYRA